MKKILSILLAVLLCVLTCAFAFAEVTQSYTDNGLTITYPDSLLPGNLKGVLCPAPYGTMNGVGNFSFFYFAVSPERYAELMSKSAEEFTEEDEAEIISRKANVLVVISIDGGRGIPELVEMAGADPDEVQYLTEFGKVEDVTFYYYLKPDERENLAADAEPEYVEEFEALREILVGLLKQAELTTPIPAGSELIGSAVSFETTDVDGNPVKSRDLFKQNKVTMLNIWATHCTYCIEEMPGLVQLNRDLAPQQAAVVGLCLDADTKMEKCRSILEEAGVDYPILMPFADINSVFEVPYLPMTYFIDSEGVILSVFGGAPDNMDMSAYAKTIDQLLKGEEAESRGFDTIHANSSGVYRVFVTDNEGDPVEDVTVQFCADNACRFHDTDENGVAEFAVEDGRVYTIHIEEVPDGYQENTQEYFTAREYCDVNIVLQKAE